MIQLRSGRQCSPRRAGAWYWTPYAVVAQRLGMSEGAVKVAVHRMRERYRDLLRLEVGQTVAGADAVEEEIASLISVLGSGK